MTLHSVVSQVTDQLRRRSQNSRSAYLKRIEAGARRDRPNRSALACGNLAHGFAACNPQEKQLLGGSDRPNIAIVSAYNDMLSAHQPLEQYPALLKQAVREVGAVAQFAGGVPAMCDGITQGRTGMELSLFSRDVIAMATVVALSHDMFDGALLLGVCDKIVPGLVIGALAFGHLPVILIPAGPMPSGLPNREKTRVRQEYAAGKVGRDVLLTVESASYHAPGTCTFYGTANSNQMLMEMMGLHLPGASFVNPGTPLREALTKAAGRRVVDLTAQKDGYCPIGRMLDERAFVNGVVGLLATGGSTNHTLHLIAMARAAGIMLTWGDFSTLSTAVPLLTRIYPNGSADVNQFHAAGGMAFLIGRLLDAGLLHSDVDTIAGHGLDRYRQEPTLEGDVPTWHDAPAVSRDPDVLRDVAHPFDTVGGLMLLSGNLGRGVIKTSAVRFEHRIVEAPIRVFDTSDELLDAYQRGELHRDVVVVVRFQGPQANGMPELHKLTPALGVLQDLGYRVALVTDGRMSGASGKVPAAIHVTPEALSGGPLARLRDGDIIRLDANVGTLEVKIDSFEFAARAAVSPNLSDNAFGTGRELFGLFRRAVGSAETGASVLFDEETPAYQHA